MNEYMKHGHTNTAAADETGWERYLDLCGNSCVPLIARPEGEFAIWVVVAEYGQQELATKLKIDPVTGWTYLDARIPFRFFLLCFGGVR